ncbi:MAG TPA: hypothetical protein VF676_01570 [Flavobacterium sp.]|jgi:hypothetical protein
MKAIFCSVVFAVMVWGCTPFQPALSLTDRSKVEEYPVKGRQGLLINQKLSFAGYETSKVKRSWTKGGNSRIPVSGGLAVDILYPDLISMGYSNRNQSFHFKMNDATGNASDVYAASEFESEDLQLGSNPNSLGNILEDVFGKNDYAENLFYVQIFVNNQPQPWQLALDNQAAQRDATEYTGIFALDKDHYYTLRPITKIAGKNGPADMPFGSVGFEVLNPQGEFVAAVSLMDNGMVYFDAKYPKERFLLANLCAALLLQQDVSE